MLGRPGYRETSCGVLPDDWSVMPLSALLHDFRGGAPLRPDDFTRSGMKVLPKGGVGWRGYLDVAEEAFQYCSDAYAANHPRNIVDQTFTIVVLRDLVPSGPTIGLMVQIRGAATYLLAQGVYGFRVDERVAIPSYLVQLSQTRWYRRLVNGIMVGSTQVHITNTAFKEAQIPVPPLPEQKAIASALSDVDALLGALDRLIAKKRDLKQAAMQQLLTGQTRLPGFSGKWETRKLGSLAHFRTGPFGSSLHKSDYTNDGIPIINPMHIIDGRLVPTSTMTITERAAQNLADFRLRASDVVIGRRGDMGRCAVVQDWQAGWLCGTGSMIVRSSPDLFAPFLQRVLSSPSVVAAIEDASVGTTMINLNQGVLAALNIETPSFHEQTAIATVLTDMDDELSALEQRRDKIRLLKQGMMQELLTGRTRLV